jgi:hypothetical protein
MPRLWMTVIGLTLAGFATFAHATSMNLDSGSYRKYTCPELLEAGREVSARASVLLGETKKTHTVSDMASTEDTIEVPGPVSEAKPVAGELALARKQLLAIEDASVQSQCEIEFSHSEQ